MARYIIRASFSQERMMYLENEGTVVYRSKDGKNQTTFPALEWLAAMCSHIPNKGMVITVTSLGGKGKRRARTTPFLVSRNRREMKKPSGGTGRD